MSFFFQFKFNLYFDVKRLSSKDELITETKDGKKLWIKAEDMSFEIYKQHLCPTIFNTDLKILSTHIYIPQYLQPLLSKKSGDCKLNFQLFSTNKI